MSIITSSQLTFCDLKDSYSIHIDNECIGLACTAGGAVLEAQEITINYRVLMGSDRINATCEVSDFPSGVTLKSHTAATSTQDGVIKLNIIKNAILDNAQSSSLKVVFTTQDDEQFTFERYITFVKCMTGADGAAGRGISQILEYYLVSPNDTGITISTSGWSTNIPTLNKTNKYLWNYEVTEFTTGEVDTTTPIIIGVYGETGASLQIKYLSSATAPTITNNDVSAWSDTMPTPSSGKTIYMTQKLSTDTNWSVPVQVSATDGETPNITISNGYWYVNGESTGVKAEGKDGETPKIAVGSNGNWYIDGVDSGTKAQGEAGKDGADIEYVYYRSKNATTLSAPSYSGTTLTSGWTTSPQGITETYKYEYMSVRKKPVGDSWGAFSTPVIWSKWGEKGQDGDGVEYKYYLSNSSTAPTYSTGASGWTDDPTGVSSTQQYEYVVQITTSNGTSSASTPALWAKFGADGSDGKGIASITNYYNVTSTMTTPTTWPYTSAPTMSSTDKYLWNYEKIVYTDGTSTSTTAAIIGVYGDSGANAITMEIYPVSGITFREDLTEIELKVAAFEGTTAISGATYQWQWWDKTTNNGAGGYVNITGATAQAFTVNASDIYALAGLRCVMTYNGQTYEDYISLINETMVYTAVVKYFNNSNIFETNDNYLVAYIELYQNNTLVESLATGQRCSNIASINSSGIITANFSEEAASQFVDGAKMYFVYEDVDNDDLNNGKYKVALGQYSASTSQWKKIDYSTQYTYTNTLYPSYPSDTNVVVISKEQINKSQNIDFTVYKDDIDIAHAHTMVIDVNDPIISDTVPQNPKDNQLWLDTSETPNVLKMYSKSKGEWIVCAEHAGQTFYTSQPSSYHEGDVWILADGETCEYTKDGVLYSFGAGSMLKSEVSTNTFDASHWIDADAEGTKVKENLKQYFEFNSTNGLKIGQVDNAFFVNISSTKMGFWSKGNGLESEVVQIGIDSATIQNATFEGGNGTTFKNDAIFEKNATFNQQINIYKQDATSGFVWKLEENNSLSLAILNVT